MSDREFINHHPKDKEWSAHIRLLNEWTDKDRVLREIVQYTRSGKFYPADMHVDLIEQFCATVIQQKLEALEGELPKERKLDNVSGKDYHNGFNACLAQITKLIDKSIGEDE